MNIIWETAVFRANARLRPVQEFMNSMRSIKKETDTQLDELENSELEMKDVYQEQTKEKVYKLRWSLLEFEKDFDRNFEETLKYLDNLLSNEAQEKLEKKKKKIRYLIV